MQASALLLVFMDVGTEATEEEFHGTLPFFAMYHRLKSSSDCPISDWYTDEHIPLRTQKFASFRSAARYRAIDGIAPKFAAMYTVSDLATFSDPAYMALREQRSERETELVGRLSMFDRRVSICPFFRRAGQPACMTLSPHQFLPSPEILTI